MHRINIAHAYVQLGDVDVALDRYRALADELHPTKRRTGRELVQADLRLFAAAGVRVADTARVRRLLTGDQSSERRGPFLDPGRLCEGCLRR